MKQNLDKTSHVQKIVELVGGALPLLAERNWSVGFAVPEAPDLVCSDVPVSLVANERFNESDETHLANRHTDLLIPLTRRTALIGTYEKRPSTFQMNELGVLSLNAYAIREAKQVFSASEDFSYLGADKQPKGIADLIRVSAYQNGKYSSLEENLNKWLQKHSL